MKVELEMFTEEDDGAIVLQKLSELATKAKDLGFIIAEAEMEAIEIEVGEEHHDHYADDEEEKH